MRSIPTFIADAATVFDDIAEAKQMVRRKRMVSSRTKVMNACQVYAAALPAVGGLSKAKLSKTQAEAMRHAFTVETQPMRALRTDILERVEVVRCPFCGMSESSSLDHYVPKETFPEFSILPLNLVPSCPHCNTLKRDRIVDGGTGVRLFLHPCFDPIPNELFLVARTRMENSALILSYRLRQPQGIGNKTFQHLTSHFTLLGLANRYRKMGLDHLGNRYPALKRAYGTDGDADNVASHLVQEATDWEETEGPNYWLAVLYRSLANNFEFCDGGFEAIKKVPRP